MSNYSSKEIEQILNHPGGKPGDSAWAERIEGETVLIVTPTLVQQKVNEIPKGTVLKLSDFEELLCGEKNIQYVNTLATVIGLKHVAETEQKNQADNTPWWRIIKDDGGMCNFWEGSDENQASLLRSEGHRLHQRDGKWRIKR